MSPPRRKRRRVRGRRTTVLAPHGSEQRESPASRSPTASFAEASSSSSPLELGADFLVSPRCFQLYEIALKASECPVPDDWKDQLSSAVEELPEEASVQDLVKVVAELSPDRARTLIQVLEEEVSVMEDVVDHEALERMKRLRREQQAELKALSANAKESRFAAIDLNGQLQSLYPGFDWDEYHSDPNYLQRVVYEREDMERLQEHDRVEEMIQQNQAEKKFLMAEIMELREKRAVLQSRLEDGCEMDLDEELGKAQRENQLLRRHYAHLCALVEQLESRDSTSSPSYSY